MAGRKILIWGAPVPKRSNVTATNALELTKIICTNIIAAAGDDRAPFISL